MGHAVAVPRVAEMEVEDKGPVIVFDEEIVVFVLDIVRIFEIEVLVLEEMAPELLFVVDDRDRLVELELPICFDNELPFEELDDEVLFKGELVFDEVALATLLFLLTRWLLMRKLFWTKRYSLKS